MLDYNHLTAKRNSVENTQTLKAQEGGINQEKHRLPKPRQTVEVLEMPWEATQKSRAIQRNTGTLARGRGVLFTAG